MNKIFSILLIFNLSIVQSQDIISAVINNSDKSNQVILNFEGYYNSYSLTNKFTSLFYKGGYLDTTLKNNISNQLFDENRIGAEITFGVTYKNYHAHFLGKPQWGWYASFEDIGNYHANFSKNAFDLLFYGNSRFAGENITLNPIEAELIHYQKLSLGTFNKTNHSYFGISFLKGQSYHQLLINNTDLYTAPFGESISGNVNATYTQSDTTSSDFSAFNGWGLSTDLVFYLNMGKNKNVKFQNAFCISIKNLGFIRWNNNTLTSTVDTQFVFNGFYVSDLFDSTSYNFSNNIEDSINIKKTNGFQTKMIPAIISFSKVIDSYSTDKFQGTYGFRLRTNAYYRPLFFAGLFYKPNEKINMTAFVSIGGYGGFKLGYQLSYAPKNNININLVSGNLLGFTSSGYGIDVSLRLAYAF